MAGIYIHIPFCKQRCTYCDFYKEIGSTDNQVDTFTDTLIQEIQLRKSYLNGDNIGTVYFGGGTPSVLNFNQFRRIFDEIHHVFNVDNDAEVTMEANPDDLTDAYLETLSSLPFNRLSIGIQSFNNKHLKIINRRHDAQQAKNAVINARKHGFQNISIDLIYALPGQTIEDWKKQLEEAFNLNVEHISAYGLTYEEGTALWKQRNKGLVKVTEDEVTLQMFNYMRLKMIEKGFESYEISNYAKPGFRSRHNSAYWQFVPYLGLGPSAHSFDGKSRQWNIASVQKYIQSISILKPSFEKEVLSEQDFYNDFIMVSLRTSDGISLADLKNRFGEELFDYCLQNADNQIKYGNLILNNNRLFLSDTGVHIANQVIIELMKTD
ncbi:Oxygen-independent coproporphyrinogen-III oxidase-like protein [bioreactor metagenome]|mgnify:CR=1 FL=1|uniref:Oxygen-independent coproporphyrinogen-III oxidase-like protein n=1 Tax=bioreactor metagenome TaxID=1076179 RepID=A0A644VMM5_9ZZZZ|nr:radical SAM family heme chaperone HemW [Paludibacter sp.]